MNKTSEKPYRLPIDEALKQDAFVCAGDVDYCYSLYEKYKDLPLTQSKKEPLWKQITAFAFFYRIGWITGIRRERMRKNAKE